MPQVPRSPDTQVRPNPIPGVRAPSVPAGAFDYTSGAQKALDVATAMYQREKQRADQIAVLDADNQLTEQETTLLHDPARGALTRQGKDAVGIVDPTLADFDRRASEIAGTLSNRTQQDAFQRLRQSRRQSVHEQVVRHAGSEQLKYDTATTEQFIANTRNEGLAKFNDPAAVAQSIERQQATYRDFAAHYGVDQQTRDNTLAKLASTTHTAVVTRMLANGDDLRAKAYYEANHEAVLFDDATKLEAGLKEGSVQGSADRLVGEVWDTLGPTTDTEPAQIDRMASSIRDKSDDPAVRAAALTNLNQRVAVQHAAVVSRAESRKSLIWNAYDAGSPVTEIYRNQDYLALSGTDRKDIRDKIAAYQDKAATQSRQQQREDLAEQRIEQEINYARLAINPVALRDTDLDDMLRRQDLSLLGHKSLAAMKDPLKSQQARSAISVLNSARTKRLFNPNDPADNDQRWATYTALLQDFIVNHPDEDPAEFVNQVLAPIETTWKQSMKDLWFSGTPGTEAAFAEKAGSLRTLAGPSVQPRQKLPAVGEIRSGYRFVGGDPEHQSSWEKVP